MIWAPVQTKVLLYLLINKFKTMAIQKVWIIDGCISCGLCSEICPEVFELNDIAEVMPNADFNTHESGIKESAENCPVEVIKFE
jgi:ferredoxin